MLRALITGASGGIGSAAVAAFRERGDRVAGLDVAARNDVIACDIRDDRAVKDAVAAGVERLGGIDVLINNAGIGFPQDSGSPPSDEALATLDVNLVGAWRVTAAALPALLESGGRVLNVASGAAFAHIPFAAAYCASKSGLVAYSDVLRMEYGHAIGVTTVLPAYHRTGILEPATRAGLSFDGLQREEPVASAARAMVRAATARRPPRYVATSRRSGLEIAAARHMPGLADRWIARRLRREVARGRFDDAPLVTAMRRRGAIRS